MEDSHLAWLLVLDKNDSRHLERIMAAGEGIWRLAKDSVPELRAQLNSYLREITEACHAIESGTESAREKKAKLLKTLSSHRQRLQSGNPISAQEFNFARAIGHIELAGSMASEYQAYLKGCAVNGARDHE
jgi:hypothetical protein